MKIIKIKLIIISFIVVFLSCIKKEDAKYGKVEILLSQDTTINITREIKPLLAESVSAIVTIYSEEKNINVLNEKQLTIRSFGNIKIIEPVELEVGKYLIKTLYILDKDGNIIFATPKENSLFAKYVSDPIDISFDISENFQNKLTCDVLPTKSKKPNHFGYDDFPASNVKIVNILLTAFLYDSIDKKYNITDIHRASIYGDNKLIYDNYLDAKTNTVTFKDANYSNFKIIVRKLGFNEEFVEITSEQLKEKNEKPFIFLFKN